MRKQLLKLLTENNACKGGIEWFNMLSDDTLTKADNFIKANELLIIF